MLKEFKKFALKGNILDLAIGVIIGGAFGKIITSLVNDILMPILGTLTGKVNLADKKWIISKGTEGVGDLTLNYGHFLQTMIDFIIVAFSIFIAMKAVNSFRKKEEEKPKVEQPSKEVTLLTEIRDLLSDKRK